MIETEVLKEEALPEIDVGSRYSLNLKEETLLKLGDFLQMRLRKLRDLRERSEWERMVAWSFNQYHMEPTQRPLPFPGAANLACPLSRIGIDSFHSNVMASLFADANKMVIQPDLIQKEFANTAKKAAQYMTYVMNHEVKFYNVFDDVDRKGHIFGNCYMEPSYVKEEIWDTIIIREKKSVPSMGPDNQVTIEEKKTERREKKKRTVFDGVKVHGIPVTSIFKSPFYSTLEECVKKDAVFKVFEISLHEIKDRSRSVEDGDSLYMKAQVEKLEPYVVQKMYKSLSELEQARADKDGFYLDLMSRDYMVELAEAYLWYDVDNDDIREEIRVIFHPASGTVLRVALSKCRIVEIIPRPVDERGYGEGIPKVLQGVSDEWENFHNTRSNAGQWENSTFGFYRAGGRFNPQQIIIQPGHFYPVDDPREVSFPNIPRVGSSYFQEEQMILSYFERLLALDENMQGVPSTKKRSATENLQVQMKQSIRFGNPFNRILSGVNELLNHIWELNQECAPDDKEFYVIGDGGSPIFDKMARYDYQTPMKFSVSVQSVFDRQMARDTWMLAYRLFTANPIVQQHPEIFWDFSQKTLKALNIDVDLPKPDQAKGLSAYEAIELIKRDQPVEPSVGIDYDHQIDVCMKQLNADDISDWDPKQVKGLVMYIDKLKILKQTIEHFNLNKSGQFVPPQGAQPPNGKQPPVTSNRNPTQMFNTTRVGESGASAQQNNRNGASGQMDQIMGNSVS